MSNRLLVTSEYNFKSGYNTLLSTILEESIKRNVVIIPKYYHKPEIEFSSFFESYPSRNGLEKELLLFPPFVYPDDGHPLLHIFNGKNKSLFTMWEATRIGDFYIDKINMFDQIIVPNNWNKESFEQHMLRLREERAKQYGMTLEQWDNAVATGAIVQPMSGSNLNFNTQHL